MSDGNTMISNVIVGHGAKAEVAVKQEHFLAAEDEALIHEEEKLMDEEISSIEDTAAEKVEQQMLTVALVNSVVETSANPAAHKGPKPDPDPECKQRYSLRKRRRPTGEALEKLESLQCSKTRSDHLAPTTGTNTTTKPPDQIYTTMSTHPVQVKIACTPAPAPPPPQPPSQQPPCSASVPACTIPLSTPLPPPVPACTVSIPAPLLPPLQPPLRTGARSPAKTKPKPKPSAKPRAAASQDKPKPRLRIPGASAQSSAEPALTAVPNPLSNPIPVASPPAVPPNSHPAFTAGTKLTVPCPLPSTTFESNASANQFYPPPPMDPALESLEPPLIEKKRVTIAPDVPEPRGRVFSIDLDPSSLDFSILDTGDSSIPGRERAFSFECFAFGINAEEPLPPGPSDCQPLRPRGDSIIFDPCSFQDGGIHEEHALTTRETRALSVDIDPASIIPSPAPSYVHSGAPRSAVAPTTYAPLPTVSSASVPSVPAVSVTTSRRLEPVRDNAYAPAPDRAPSTIVVRTAPGPPPRSLPARLPVGRAPSVSQPHLYPAATMHAIPSAIGVPGSSLPPNTAPSNLTSTGAIAPVGAAATTFQMELLNKDGRIGIYLPEARRERIARFHAKRKMRIWRKRIKYDCRKKLADSRPRIKGRFVKRSDMD